MKFKINLADFQKVLQKTIPAIPKKSTLPILEHLLFTLTDNNLKIIATDQDITIMTTVVVQGEQDGRILVPGHRVRDIAKALGNEGSIEFNAVDVTFEIKILTASGKYNMKGLNPDDYLDIPELFDSPKPVIDKIEFTAKLPAGKVDPVFFKKDDIIRIANKTFFAVSTDEFRPAMNGVLFQFKGNVITGVSTDSYRMVRIIKDFEKSLVSQDLEIIVPSRAVDLLRRVDDDVVISVIESKSKITHARFDVGDTVFITRLIDEKFPPYDSVIPQNNEILLVVNQKDFIAAIKRVSIFTNAVSHQIRVKIDKSNLQVVGEDEDTGSNANETVNCDYTGKKMDVGFNWVYLEEVLQNIELEENNPNVILMFSEPNRPVIIRPHSETDEILMLIMPVRL